MKCVKVRKVDFAVISILEFLKNKGLPVERDTVVTALQQSTIDINGIDAAELNEFIERVLNKECLVSLTMSPDTVVAVEDWKELSKNIQERIGFKYGFRVWFSSDEKDCWTLTADTYNNVLGSFTKDSTTIYKSTQLPEDAITAK